MARLSYSAWIVLSFVLSRIVYYALGVRFQTHILHENFQFIDVHLLATRMWESLYYFHMQPPLMNALLGVLVKSFPDGYGEAMHWVFMAAGLAGALLLFRLMRYLDVNPKLACTLVILYSISPGTVFFENFPTYEYLIALLLLGASVTLYKVVERPAFWIASGFFVLLALLAYIRALYHLYFIVLLVPVLAWYVRRSRRAVLAAALVPCILIFALYLKNRTVFNFFGASSWLGYAMATCTIHQLSDAEREELIQAGRLAPIARVEAPSLIEAYAPFVPAAPRTGIPVLDEPIKSTGGLNTNDLVYLKADKLYQEASKQVLRAKPQAYVRSLMIAWFCYFLPPSDFFQFDELRQPIRSVDRFLNVAEFGQFRETTRKGLRALKAEGHTLSLVLYTGTFLIVLCPLLLGWGVLQFWTRPLTRAQKAVIVFVIANIVFIMLTTNFLSSFENNRYRFPTDCLYLTLLATLIQSRREYRS